MLVGRSFKMNPILKICLECVCVCVCACVRACVCVCELYNNLFNIYSVPSVSNVPNLSCCAVFKQDSYSQDMSRICFAYYNKIALCSSRLVPV